jgi:ribonuclease R
VHITELGGEYYRYDEVHQELRGERSGARYAVGTRVRVQVSRVDLDSRRIDFRLVRDGEPGLPVTRARGERARAPNAVEELLSVQEADRAGKAAARRKAGKKTAASGAAVAKPARTTRDRKTPTRTRR